VVLRPNRPPLRQNPAFLGFAYLPFWHKLKTSLIRQAPAPLYILILP
jgi:hypothetical protein